MSQRDYPVANVSEKIKLALSSVNDYDIDYVIYWIKNTFPNKYFLIPMQFDIGTPFKVVVIYRFRKVIYFAA